MRHLYKIDDNGATYWVMAPTGERALSLLHENDGYEPDDLSDPPIVQEKCTRETTKGVKFSLDGAETDQPKFSMWDAYQIAHLYGDGVLACSEW